MVSRTQSAFLCGIINREWWFIPEILDLDCLEDRLVAITAAVLYMAWQILTINEYSHSKSVNQWIIESGGPPCPQTTSHPDEAL